MGPAPRTLELFYDVLSPYSWLGFEVLCRYQHLWNVRLHLRPCLFKEILKDSGRNGEALVQGEECSWVVDFCGLEGLSYINKLPAPREGSFKPWTLKSLTRCETLHCQETQHQLFLEKPSDLHRLNRHFQVPIKMPKEFFPTVFKKGSGSSMRFLTAVNMEQPEMLEKVSRELWMCIWSRDEDITEPQSILAAAEKAGLAAEQAQGLLEKISTTQVKNQLKETTEAACKYGAFGLPVTVAHIDGKAHMLFGSDRLELLAFLLGEKWMGPSPQAINV